MIVRSTGFWGCSLQLACDSLPCVSYTGYQSSTFGHEDELDHEVLYAYQDGETWHWETADIQGGSTISLGLGSGGSAHIAYFHHVDSTLDYLLRHAYRDGSGWHIQSVGPEEYGHWYLALALALDSLDFPHVAYRNGYGSTQYAREDAAGWHIQSIGPGYGGTTLALDGAGWPHVSYNSGSADFALRYAHEDAMGWHILTVDDYGRSPSLVLDGLGYPHISYGCGDGLCYAVEDGGGWRIQTVDSLVNSGGETSLALDACGYAHISYHDYYFNYDLKYAYEDAAGWHIQALDTAGDVGYTSSLAVDVLGRVHICYVENGALKYARMVRAPVGADSSFPLRIAAVNVWPNPARGVVHARLAGTGAQSIVGLTVVDLLGRRVMSLEQQETMRPEATMTLRLPETLPTGQYFLGVEGEGSRQFVPITVVK
jgi:hypothetical protein